MLQGLVSPLHLGSVLPRAAEVRKMKQLKESNARTETAETAKSSDRSIVKSIRNTMIIGLPLTTVLSGVLAIGFAVALDGCSSKEKVNTTAQTSLSLSAQPTMAISQPTPEASPTPAPVAKKRAIVKKPLTVVSADNKNGISLRDPRKFTLERREGEGRRVGRPVTCRCLVQLGCVSGRSPQPPVQRHLHRPTYASRRTCVLTKPGLRRAGSFRYWQRPAGYFDLTRRLLPSRA